MLGQIAPGNAVHRLERVLQWIDDLPCDDPCGECAQQQGQGRDESERGLGGRGIGIAFGILRFNQFCVVSSSTSPNCPIRLNRDAWSTLGVARSCSSWPYSLAAFPCC